MIKPIELRIGNWLQAEVYEFMSKTPVLEKYQVSAIHRDCFYFEDFDGNVNPAHWHGIPLTPEILDKCGFKRGVDQSGGFHGYFNGKLWLDNSFQFDLADGRWDHSGTLFYSPESKCLHQLQNVYRILTGEELTYTP